MLADDGVLADDDGKTGPILRTTLRHSMVEREEVAGVTPGNPVTSFFNNPLYRALRYRRPVCWVRLAVQSLTGKARRMPVSSLVNMAAFSFSQDGWHPYTELLKQIDNNPDLKPETSVLREFYDRFTPETRDGFLPVHADGQWESDMTCYRPPWGGGKDVDCGDEFEHWTGPKSAEAVESLFRRINGIYQTLKAEGYHPWTHNDGLIRVIMLEKPNSDFRCLVVGGQHRAAIVSHLGLKTAWVQIQAPGKLYPDNMPNRIKLSQIDTWPGVVSKEYSRRDARRFFESYFEYDGIQQAESIGMRKTVAADK